MRTLEVLKSIPDGGSFDGLVKKVEEAAGGDQSLKQELLTEAVLPGFIRKARELAVKAKQSNFRAKFVNLRFRIPQKKRRRYVGVGEEKKQRQGKVDSCLEEKRKKKERTSIKKNHFRNEFVNLSFNIPKKTRRCFFGVGEEEKQRIDSCLEEKREKKKRTIIKKNHFWNEFVNLRFNIPKKPRRCFFGVAERG